MFGFFKKKKSEPAAAGILNLDDHAFVQAVSRMVCDGHPAAATMCLIASENLRPLMGAAFTLARQKTDQQMPSDLDGLIRFFAESSEKDDADEVARRRIQWFFLAALIVRAGGRSAADATLVPSVVEMWLYLAKSGELLAETVKQNQLWDTNEKIWFQHLRTPSDGVGYVLQHMVPKHLKSQPKLREFAQQRGVMMLGL
jgi:hypothetical protein